MKGALRPFRVIFVAFPDPVWLAAPWCPFSCHSPIRVRAATKNQKPTSSPAPSWNEPRDESPAACAAIVYLEGMKLWPPSVLEAMIVQLANFLSAEKTINKTE